MDGQGASPAILVTGDFVVDHHIYEGRRHHYGDAAQPGVRTCTELGGAALVHRLLAALLDSGAGKAWSVLLAVDARQAEADSARRAYATWRPFPSSAPAAAQFWRVAEAMGFGEGARGNAQAAWKAAESLPDEPQIIVISEGGMGFRADEERWQGLAFSRADAIVLRSSAPVASGALWTLLSGEYHEKLAVVVTASDLRKAGARIGSGLSWENSAEGLLREMRPDGRLNPLRRCRHLLVAFESEGGIWIDFETPGSPKVRLVYDTSAIEGDHALRMQGRAFGFISCLTASVAAQLALGGGHPDLRAAIEGGLSAMRDLRERGHGPAGDEPNGFPAQRLAGIIKHPAHRYSWALLPHEPMPGWTILDLARRTPTTAIEMGRLAMLHGPIALRNVPHFVGGKLLSAERSEVECLRNLRQAVRRYQQGGATARPLSIGVFGPPGSGKSFAVGELMSELLGGSVDMITCNLSQIHTPAELVHTFHRIRDKVLEGKLPVAFFDEFDVRNYEWLPQLLAPMQDGCFAEAGHNHPIGKCIFICAGGTSDTYDAFGQTDAPAFRMVKGTDFKGRLDAYLDICGPNPRAGAHDIAYPIRRALMIRGQLRSDVDANLEIEEELVAALLQVSRYTHGSRSLEKLLEPFKGSYSGPLRLSALNHAQLAMHTDATEFQRFAAAATPRRSLLPMTKDEIERMAIAIHETYTALGLRVGWLKSGEELPFAGLRPFLQESNRAAARRMAEILPMAGLHLEEGTATPADEEAVRQHLAYRLDLLAKAEHDGWMDWHLSQGWRRGPKKDPDKCEHPALVPYSKLSEADQNKDRDSIRHYPEFARAAGKKIAFDG